MRTLAHRRNSSRGARTFIESPFPTNASTLREKNLTRARTGNSNHSEKSRPAADLRRKAAPSRAYGRGGLSRFEIDHWITRLEVPSGYGDGSQQIIVRTFIPQAFPGDRA